MTLTPESLTILQKDIAFIIGNDYDMLDESQQVVINNYIESELELMFEEHNFNLSEFDTECLPVIPKETANRYKYEFAIPEEAHTIKNLVNVFMDRECREAIIDYLYQQQTHKIFTNYARSEGEPIYIIYNIIPPISQLQNPYIRYLSMRVANLIAFPFTNSPEVAGNVRQKLMEAKTACINYDTRQKSGTTNPLDSFGRIARTTFR
jgi:hypothetical protein